MWTIKYLPLTGILLLISSMAIAQTGSVIDVNAANSDANPLSVTHETSLITTDIQADPGNPIEPPKRKPLVTQPSSRILGTYPSPASSYLTVELENVLPTRVELVDLNGYSVSQLPLPADQGTFDVRNTPSGMYIVRITTDDMVMVRKVMVVH